MLIMAVIVGVTIAFAVAAQVEQRRLDRVASFEELRWPMSCNVPFPDEDAAHLETLIAGKLARPGAPFAAFLDERPGAPFAAFLDESNRISDRVDAHLTHLEALPDRELGDPSPA